MAGRITKSFIDQLLARADIVEVVGQVVSLRKTGRDFQGLCPFHNEKTPSFTVSPEKQFYHCFGCGAHGSAIGFLMNHGGLGFADAVHELASRSGLEVEYEGGQDLPREDHGPLYAILDEAAQAYARLLREHPDRARAVDYLKRRGLTGTVAKKFGIGFAPDAWDTLVTALGTSGARLQLLQQAGLAVARDTGGHYDRFRDRIMFPIRDRRGRCIAFGGRVLDQGEPKYLNSPETPIFHKRRELYGLDLVARLGAKLTRVLIVEGYMDVVALVQHSVDNVVATLGTATTGEHLEQLFRLVPEVVFCFDGDAAGQRASWRALEAALPLMQDGRSAGFLFLPEGQDPDSLVRTQGPGPFQGADNVLGLSELLFRHLSAQVDLGSLEGRARLVALARPLIQKVPTGTFRQLLTERLGEIARTRVDAPAAASTQASRAPMRKALPPGPRHRVPPVLDRALAMLLHRPALAREAEDFPALDVTQEPKLALLVTLLERMRDSPDVTTGALLESLRDTPHYALVEELLRVPLVLDPDLWATEFKGALAQVLRAARRNYFSRLVPGESTQPAALDAATKARLQGRTPGE